MPPPWGSRSGRVVFVGLLCVLLLCLVSLTGHAQSVNLPSLQELRSNLLIANEALVKLVPLSQDQEKRIEGLQTDLTKLREQLDGSQVDSGILNEQLISSLADLATSRVELQRASDLLGKLLTQYNELSQSVNDYRTEMGKQVATLERERTFWKVVGIGGGAAAIVAIIVAIIK